MKLLITGGAGFIGTLKPDEQINLDIVHQVCDRVHKAFQADDSLVKNIRTARVPGASIPEP